MSDLPEAYQVEFWTKNLQPLLQEEQELRQTIEAEVSNKPGGKK